MSNKYLIGAALGVVALIGIGQCQAKADPMIDQVFDPSVRLGGYCSGQIIRSHRDDKTGKVETYVLSAKHCLKDDVGKIIQIQKEVHSDELNRTSTVSYDAKVLGVSYKSDLGIVKLNDESTFFDHTGEVAKNDIKLVFGQNVEVVGYPLGLSMTWTEGKLGFIEEQPAFGDISQSRLFYRATPDTTGGSSGSAMYTFDGGKYKIIGILTGGYNRGTYINYYTPIKEINEYLDTALPKIDEPKKDEKKTEVPKAKDVTIKVYQ